MLTATTLVAAGRGATITLGCKSKISEGSGVPGFAPEAMMYDGPCNGSLSAGKLDWAVSLDGGSLGGANGTFIRNKDDKVTMGVAKTGGFIASDQFGGCDLTILRNPAGAMLGAHVYSSDPCRTCVANPPFGWSVVGTWRSSGYAAKWPGLGGLIAFAFFEGKTVKVVAVGVKGYPGRISNLELAATFRI